MMNEQDLSKALGPLAALYSDPSIVEILVDAHDRVCVERLQADHSRVLEDVPSPFDSPEAVRAVIDASLALNGIVLGPHKTMGEMRLPDGARFLAVIPPTAIEGPCLVIRRLGTTIFSWEELLEWGVLSRQAYDVLQSAMRAKVNTLIAGNAGSGKTTLANMLVDSIPPEERVVVVEDVGEMIIRRPRSVHLEAGGPANVSYEELVVTGSCMRPDWLVVGELHGPEAMQALQVMARGHTGLATAHATSVEDALSRLEAACLMANLGLGLSEIRVLVASALRLIVFQERLPDGRRRITHIVELRGVENDRYVLQPLFRYDLAEGKLEATGARPSWEE